MKVLVSDNQIIVGPRHWHQRIFQSAVNEDLEMDVILPVLDDRSPAYEVASGVMILPVELEPTSDYNPKIHTLAGPFWTFQSDKAIGRYEVRDSDIDSVKSNLKKIVADTRWKKEVEGIVVNIQGIELAVSTARDDRDIYAQAFILGDLEKKWKFGDNWITLTGEELKTITSAINLHIEESFKWEYAKILEIDVATDLYALDVIEVNKFEKIVETPVVPVVPPEEVPVVPVEEVPAEEITETETTETDTEIPAGETVETEETETEETPEKESEDARTESTPETEVEMIEETSEFKTPVEDTVIAGENSDTETQQ